MGISATLHGIPDRYAYLKETHHGAAASQAALSKIDKGEEENERLVLSGRPVMNCGLLACSCLRGDRVGAWLGFGQGPKDGLGQGSLFQNPDPEPARARLDGRARGGQNGRSQNGRMAGCPGPVQTVKQQDGHEELASSQ